MKKPRHVKIGLVQKLRGLIRPRFIANAHVGRKDIDVTKKTKPHAVGWILRTLLARPNETVAATLPENPRRSLYLPNDEMPPPQGPVPLTGGSRELQEAMDKAWAEVVEGKKP